MLLGRTRCRMCREALETAITPDRLRAVRI